MKITIDTKEDSHDEIKKIVNMLNSLIEANIAESGELSGGLSSEPSSDSPPIVGEGIFGMFSDNNEQEAPPTQSETSLGSEVTGVLNENKEETVNMPEPDVVENVKKDDDKPRIVPY